MACFAQQQITAKPYQYLHATQKLHICWSIKLSRRRTASTDFEWAISLFLLIQQNRSLNCSVLFNPFASSALVLFFKSAQMRRSSPRCTLTIYFDVVGQRASHAAHVSELSTPTINNPNALCVATSNYREIINHLNVFENIYINCCHKMLWYKSSQSLYGTTVNSTTNARVRPADGEPKASIYLVECAA